jgi:sugar phosphate isomerase/epimerase
MRTLPLFFLCAALGCALDEPLYVFDNGTGRGVLPIDEQVDLAKRAGYAGVFYSGTKEIPQLIASHKARGMKILGIYTGMNLNDPQPSYDPGLPLAIRQLRGTGALITFTVNGKAADADEKSVKVIAEVCDMAEAEGLKVAIYPHFGFHVATIEDALRIIEKAKRPNLGLVFNLCHWLRSGDEANLELRLKQAARHILMVSINGADRQGDWDRLIQTLDRGEYDVKAFLARLKAAGYRGPFGLQCYNVKGDREENLARSMKAWRSF